MRVRWNKVAFAILALASFVLAVSASRDPAAGEPITGTTERVSVSSDGTEGNWYSHFPSISADGRYVAFQSAASNLVPGDTNGYWDVFVRDRLTGTTELVSVSSDGTQGNDESYDRALSISADGRFVAFGSEASNLVPGDTNGHSDVFVRDRLTGTTERVSVSSDGTQGNYGGYWPSISADGRYVAFHSPASNLVPGDTNGHSDVFVRDRCPDGLCPSAPEPTPTPEPTPPPEPEPASDRKVILIQGIDSSSFCEGDPANPDSFKARRQEIVSLVLGTNARVDSPRVPDYAAFRAQDVVGLSYSGLYKDCKTGEIYSPGDPFPTDSASVVPVYSESATCGGIESARKELDRIIKAYPSETKFDIITHSMGGFVALYWVAKASDAEVDRVRSIVALDSPLLGAPARNPLSGCDDDSQSWSDLKRGSDVVRTINTYERTTHRVNLLTIPCVLLCVGDGPISGVWKTVTAPCAGHGCPWHDGTALSAIAEALITDVFDDRTLRAKGSWGTEYGVGYLRGRVLTSTKAGDSISFTFEGSELVLVYWRQSTFGVLGVLSVDGKVRSETDGHVVCDRYYRVGGPPSDNYLCQLKITLENGEHRVKLQLKKCRLCTSSFKLDAFEILPNRRN